MFCKDVLYMPRSKKGKTPSEDFVQSSEQETIASVNPAEELVLSKREEVNRNLKNFKYYFGQELKRRRKELNLSQRDISYALGVFGMKLGQPYISSLETGRRGNPTLEVIVVLSTILSISLDRFFVVGKEIDTLNEGEKDEREDGKENE